MHQRFFMQIEGVRTEKMIFTCVTFVFFTILVAVISYVKTKGDDQTPPTAIFWQDAVCRVSLSQARCC